MKVTVPKGTMITLECDNKETFTIPSEVEIEFRYTHGTGLNMNGDDLTMVYFYNNSNRPLYNGKPVYSIKWSIKSCIII
jgi:hypothetical protein